MTICSVHVLHVGPLNKNNQYEYAVMSTNCNFPIYVFARDPTEYKRVSSKEDLFSKTGSTTKIQVLITIGRKSSSNTDSIFKIIFARFQRLEDQLCNIFFKFSFHSITLKIMHRFASGLRRWSQRIPGEERHCEWSFSIVECHFPSR